MIHIVKIMAGVTFSVVLGSTANPPVNDYRVSSIKLLFDLHTPTCPMSDELIGFVCIREIEFVSLLGYD